VRWQWFAVIAVAVVFRAYALTNDLLYDPLTYAQYAYNIAEGTFTLRDNYAFAHRLPVFVPVAPLYGIFGVNVLTTHLWPLLLSMAQVVLVMITGRRLFDDATAVLAGLLLAISPLDALYGVLLGPDVALAAFLTAAVTGWILGSERGRAEWVVAAGACFAIAVSIRMYAVLAVPVFLGHALWKRVPIRYAVWFVLGGAGAVAAIGAIYWRTTGDPLYALRVQAQSFGRQDNPEGVEPLYYVYYLLHWYSSAGLSGLLYYLGAGFALLRPTPARLLVLLWIAPLALYLQFGSMSFSSYEPVWKATRYLTPLFAPLSLLAASLLVSAAGTRGGRGRAVLVGVVMVAVGIASALVIHRERGKHLRSSDAYEMAAVWLRENPSIPAYYDHWRTALAASYYLGFREESRVFRDASDSLRIGSPETAGDSRVRYLAWYRSSAEVPAGFVVVDRPNLDRAKKAGSPAVSYLGVHVPEFAFAPPASWRLLWRRGPLELYWNPGPESLPPPHAPSRAG
jgi:4-amino-4-deoxy-L-arabinose transferase-like glycosyltransferase